MSLESQPPRSQSQRPEQFSCEVQPERGAVRVHPVGSLDVATADVLDAQLHELREAGFRRLIVDLGKLEFMDSTGLRLLLEWDAESRADGFGVEVAPGPPAVQRVFELTGTASLLRFTSEQAARSRSA
jgi:anti-anti-sigma factor